MCGLDVFWEDSGSSRDVTDLLRSMTVHTTKRTLGGFGEHRVQRVLRILLDLNSSANDSNLDRNSNFASGTDKLSTQTG